MIPRLVSHSPSTPVPKRTAEEEAQHCDDVGRRRKERAVMKSGEQEDKQLSDFTSCSIHKSTKTWGGKEENTRRSLCRKTPNFMVVIASLTPEWCHILAT